MATGFVESQREERLIPRVRQWSLSHGTLSNYGLLVAVSLFACLALIATEGNLYVAGYMVGITLIVLLTFYRLTWGLFIFVTMSFLFDQFSEFDSSITTLVRYFATLNTFPQIQSTGIGVLTPLEIHLLFLIAVWIVTGILKRDLSWVPVQVWGPMVLLLGWLLLALLRGRLSGGDLMIGLWEVRGLIVFSLLFLLVPQVLKTKEEISILMWILILTVTFKALQAATRFALLGFSFGNWPNIYDTLSNNHEDAILIGNLLLFLVALVFFSESPKQRRFLRWVLPINVLGFIAANRRSAFAAFGACVLAFVILLPKEKRRVLMRFAGVGVVFFGLYLGAFWNSAGTLGTIARQVKGTLVSDPAVSGERNYSSDLARKQENYNLAMTVRRVPVVGLGLGMRYDMVIQLWGYRGMMLYLGHNGIMSLFAKTGAIGFFLFWFFFNCYIVYGTRCTAKLQDPYLKVICILAVLSIVSHLVFSYVDTGVTYARSMVWLAILMAMVPVTERLNSTHPKPAPADRNGFIPVS